MLIIRIWGYVNDIPEEINNFVSLFADGAKVITETNNYKGYEELQNDSNNIFEWSKRWEYELNASK